MVTAGTPLNVAPSNIVILLFSKLSMRKLFKPSNARSEMLCVVVVRISEFRARIIYRHPEEAATAAHDRSRKIHLKRKRKRERRKQIILVMAAQ